MAKTGETQDRCTQYALDVVSGKITAGEYVRLACQRHLDDIEKSKAAPYKYYFDVEKSEEIINFAEELTIAEGEENEHVTAYPLCDVTENLSAIVKKQQTIIEQSKIEETVKAELRQEVEETDREMDVLEYHMRRYCDTDDIEATEFGKENAVDD